MSKLVFLMSVTLASPAWSQDHSGFYLGGDVSVFETRYENLTIEGDGTALGIHAGYRYVIDSSVFIEGEGFAATINGGTNDGSIDFESYYGLTIGAGAYLLNNFYGLFFAGIANINSEDVDFGSRKDDGIILGLGVGYDITPEHSVGLRCSIISVDGAFGYIDTDVLAIRYSYHF
ncbi:outer membrane beta-barrel protein [uncultured Ruegeria sp.]|uniref:outer membrane beta-barrel protein n=1 Tax=uncultured Ruegeria sp. TaxID=259304 RepID=UPI00261C32EE|nr:outer membrane beta-barrel protein [uncultured Ruegeria sp.]